MCVQSSESHTLDVQKPPHGEWLTLPKRMLFIILVEQAEGEGDHASLGRAELGKRGNEKGSVLASQAAYQVGLCGTTDCLPTSQGLAVRTIDLLPTAWGLAFSSWIGNKC